MVDIARKMLFHEPVRFAITVLGVAFAVLLVVVQIGLFLGLLNNASITIEHADADLWVTSRNTPNIDFGHSFPDSNVQRIRSVPGVARADNLIVTYAQVALPNGAEETAVLYAMEDFARWGLPWVVAEGNVEDLRRGRTMLLDDSATRRFGAFRVGEAREVNRQRLDIVGRSRGAKSFTTMPIMFVRFRLAQQLVPDELEGRTMYAVVKLEPGANAATVAAEIRSRLPYNDVFTKKEWSERTRDYWTTSTGIGLNMGLTVFLGCLVGLVVVAQTLYASTLEHLAEFGTVKAIGGSNRDIYAILVRQAVISAVVGYVVGLVPCFAVAKLASDLADADVVLSPTILGVVFAGTVGLCVLAASVSFRKVASIDPALVFRA
jgi:putative ABC transport system permease protein